MIIIRYRRDKFVPIIDSGCNKSGIMKGVIMDDLENIIKRLSMDALWNLIESKEFEDYSEDEQFIIIEVAVNRITNILKEKGLLRPISEVYPEFLKREMGLDEELDKQ